MYVLAESSGGVREWAPLVGYVVTVSIFVMTILYQDWRRRNDQLTEKYDELLTNLSKAKAKAWSLIALNGVDIFNRLMEIETLMEEVKILQRSFFPDLKGRIDKFDTCIGGVHEAYLKKWENLEPGVRYKSGVDGEITPTLSEKKSLTDIDCQFRELMDEFATIRSQMMEKSVFS